MAQWYPVTVRYPNHRLFGPVTTKEDLYNKARGTFMQLAELFMDEPEFITQSLSGMADKSAIDQDVGPIVTADEQLAHLTNVANQFWVAIDCPPEIPPEDLLNLIICIILNPDLMK